VKASCRVGVVVVVAVALGVPLALSARQPFSPLIVFGHSIGGIHVGDKWSSILATYGPPDKIDSDTKGLPGQPLKIDSYKLAGGGGLSLFVHAGRVLGVETNSRYFHTLEHGHVGLYRGKRVQDYLCDTSAKVGTFFNHGHCDRSLTTFRWYVNCYSFVKSTGGVDNVVELSLPTALDPPSYAKESRYPILWIMIGSPSFTKALGCSD
jgi:hypothetical protein